MYVPLLYEFLIVSSEYIEFKLSSLSTSSLLYILRIYKDVFVNVWFEFELIIGFILTITLSLLSFSAFIVSSLILNWFKIISSSLG